MTIAARARQAVDMPLRLDNANALPTYPQRQQKQKKRLDRQKTKTAGTRHTPQNVSPIIPVQSVTHHPAGQRPINLINSRC